jgi:hypothetical protein
MVVVSATYRYILIIYTSIYSTARSFASMNTHTPTVLFFPLAASIYNF